MTGSYMLYGAHIYLFTDKWTDDQLPILDQIADLGLGACELSVGDDIIFDPTKTRARAEQLDLKLLIGPGGAWPVHCDLSADQADDRHAGLAWHKRQVDLAAELGAVAYAGALYGHPGVIKRRRPPADEAPRTAEGLGELAEYAAARDVAIVLEPMSHFRTHVANTPQQVLTLIDMADHHNLFVLFDTYHLITEVRDYGAAVRACGDRLWGVHACENDRGVPGGGLVPWDDLFQALADINYTGYLGMETYNSSIGDFAFQRGLFLDPCPDGTAFVKQGKAFLQGLAAKYL
ncbi:MAG: sugar phosphate isomerase/epimerase [Caldilineaceae bacterium]|nr:sugar phosphate isomerase/epimerase [Caldilineaceae bacterium]